jgi:hypothetical protein
MRVVVILLVGLLVSCTQTETQDQPEVQSADTLLVTDTTIYWNGHELINESP